VSESSAPKGEPPSEIQVAPEQQVENVLAKSAPEIPEAKRQEVAQRITQVTAERYSGPVPHPEMLARYETIVPGSAERLISMAERSMAHQISMESTMLTKANAQTDRGQHYGLAVALTGLIGAFTLVLCGHDAAGGVLGGTTLLGMVGVFVTGKVMETRASTRESEK
jgi:uncharacterized membrane protein